MNDSSDYIRPAQTRPRLVEYNTRLTCKIHRSFECKE